MTIFLYDVYRTPNIGIFMKSSENFLLVPMGYSPSKSQKMAECLGLKPINTSMSGTRLLGPLIAMNSNGILVSGLADEIELELLRKATGLAVERFSSPFTATGNLFLVNDRGALASSMLGEKEINQAKRVFGVRVIRGNIAGYHQVGSVGYATNRGVLIHPNASKSDIETVASALESDVEVGSVNGGVPFVSSGIIGKVGNVIVGRGTMGPELFIIGKVFKAN